MTKITELNFKALIALMFCLIHGLSHQSLEIGLVSLFTFVFGLGLGGLYEREKAIQRRFNRSQNSLGE